MQKIVALVTVLLIGGGAYVYFYNPELKETITDSVSKMMTGSSMQNVSAYEKDFKKEGIQLEDVKESHVAGINDSLTVSTFKDADGGSLLLGHSDEEVKIMRAVFDPDKGSMGKYVGVELERMFDGEIDLTSSGSKKNEYGEATWKVEDGKVSISINSNNVKKAPTVDELPEEQQEKLTELRELITKKVKMQNEWRLLDDEKHFCLDQHKFKAITKRMSDLKVQAEELTANAKKIMRDLPMPQVLSLREELEGGHL